MPGQRLFKTVEEVDAYIREERDSWAGFYGITELLSPDSLDRHDFYLAEEYMNDHEPE